MGKKNKGLMKKKTFWQYLKNNYSKDMKAIALIFSLLITNVLIAIWEYKCRGIFEKYSMVKALFILTICNIIVELSVFSIIWHIISIIRKCIATYNLCYFPLTKEDIQAKGFSDAGRCFKYAKKLLCYEPINQLCVKLKQDDFREMLAACLKTFPEDNGTIFALQGEDCFMCPVDFVEFIYTYNNRKNEGVVRKEKIKIQNNKIYLEYDFVYNDRKETKKLIV